MVCGKARPDVVGRWFTGAMVEPSEYIVFVDESGTPVTQKPDPGFPIFSLQFVLVRKDVYSHQIVPELVAFKLKHHGSDSTILHGKKIDAKDGEFRMLQDNKVFEEYVSDLDGIIREAKMELFSAYFLHFEVAGLDSLQVHPSNRGFGCQASSQILP